MSFSLLAVETVNVLAVLPDPDPVAPPGFEGMTTLLGWARWGVLVAAIMSFLILAVMFMFNSRRGEGGEHVKGFVITIICVMIAGAATSLVGFIAGA